MDKPILPAWAIPATVAVVVVLGFAAEWLGGTWWNVQLGFLIGALPVLRLRR